MISYEGFKGHVLNNILDYLPEEYSDATVTYTTTSKNNSMMEGINVKLPDCNIGPTIFFRPVYDEMSKNMELSAVMKEIAESFVKLMPRNSFDISMVSDFDRVRDKIIPRVVGLEGNESHLEGKAFTIQADLAVVYMIVIDENEDGMATIAVTNEMAKAWAVSPDVLHHLAKDNIPHLCPASIVGMSQFMSGMLPKEQAEAMGITLDVDPCDEAIFVLTNKQSVGGAAVMVSDEAMDMVREHIQGDFYILPSSVHEVLCVRATPQWDLQYLKEMVQEVNATQVEPQDRLSDNVYKYDYARHELYRADQEQQRQAELNANQARGNGARV